MNPHPSPGTGARAASAVRAVGLGASAGGLAVLELEADPLRAVEAIVEQAERAVRDDKAEVICLGCGGMAGLDEQIRQRTGVPVVDGVTAAVTIAESLVRMGVRHLHQLLALPRDSLARRFPAEVLAQLDTLLGHRPLPLEFYRPPDVFDIRIELNFEVESHQALLFPLRRLPAQPPQKRRQIPGVWCR